MVGVGVGRRVGTSVGRAVVGSSVGKAVGRSDGTQEGVIDGRSVGVSVGLVEGTYVGDSLNGASVTCTMTLRWERGPRGRETRSVRPSRYPVHRRCPTATADGDRRRPTRIRAAKCAAHCAVSARRHGHSVRAGASAFATCKRKAVLQRRGSGLGAWRRGRGMRASEMGKGHEADRHKGTLR